MTEIDMFDEVRAGITLGLCIVNTALIFMILWILKN